MRFEQKLQLKLSQKLILTPALQQAIKLLPLARLELVDLLNQEVVENPLLEEVSTDELPLAEATSADRDDPDAPSTLDTHDSWNEADYASFFGEYLDGYRPRTPREFRERPPFENTLSRRASLADHLTWQLSAHAGDERARRIGTAIIGNLDDDGYLAASTREIAEVGGWTQTEVARMLEVVQAFDPIGVAARDLRESLLLQLRHRGLDKTLSEVIVRDHLELVPRYRLPELGRQLGRPVAELQEHVDVILRLDPKPGGRFHGAPCHYVIPDIYVRKVDDRYVAVANDDGLPQLRISPVYRRMLDEKAKHSVEIRSYVKDKFRSALWLMKSVDQRQKTIQKVATSIVAFEQEFFDHGIESLRPLVLRDVATDIGMHESTVSRVVTNKYMDTPQGVVEMKYFFHSGIAGALGKNISSVAVKQRIRRMIEAENSQKPLSDSGIARKLEEQGLVLARRTISKYREECQIPSSTRRRATNSAPAASTSRLGR